MFFSGQEPGLTPYGWASSNKMGCYGSVLMNFEGASGVMWLFSLILCFVSEWFMKSVRLGSEVSRSMYVDSGSTV